MAAILLACPGLNEKAAAATSTATVPSISSLTDDANAGKTAPAPASATAAPAEVKSSVVENSVVRIFCTARPPDCSRPWTKQAPHEVSGTGIVLDGKRILTNAHVVLYASQVQVQANQEGDKISATVEAIAPGIDLAVLKLDDEKFFDAHPPLQWAKALPEVKDAIMVYGYPRGGTSLSITKGIVSRVEFSRYSFSTSGLRIQIDAAINPGNSGGPAVVGDKLVGIAFSMLSDAQNIGYIIPCEEIDTFLKDVAKGPYVGKPMMFDELQTLENSALRSFLKLDPAVKGIVVHQPYGDDAAYPLKEWDVITKIGDTPLDDEGMIKLGPDLRVDFRYQIQKIAKNGKVPLTIVRAGKEMAVELPVSVKRSMLIQDLEGAYPPYFVYGPLVFSTATSQYLRTITGSEMGGQVIKILSVIGSPLMTRSGDKPAFEGESLVVVPSPFFPHKLSKGYSTPITDVVKTVNGIKIKNLNHLVEVLRDLKDEFVVFQFDHLGGEGLVFPRKEMVAATDEILKDNDVLSQGSAEAMAIWNAKPAAK